MSPTTPTSVYRYYDADRKLIYVGITGKGMVRQTQHNSHADWWRFVSTQEVEHVDTRAAALHRERELIDRFRPPFNREHNPDWQRLRAAYLAHVDAAASPHAGPLTCEYGDPAACTAFSAGINEHWCGRADCAVCHTAWHAYERGFEEGGDNEQRVVTEDLAALCAAEDAEIRTAALAARAALTALVETVGANQGYDILVGPVRSIIPSDRDVLDALDVHAQMRADSPAEDPWTTGAPF